MNHNSNPFELYSSMSGWREASVDIEAVIKVAKRQVAKGVDPQRAYREVRAVLHKYSPWGAADTEPRWAAADLFCQGTDMDPSDFYC
jgi:hypothetical protein